MKALTEATSKILLTLMAGGMVQGSRLYPGPWHYELTSPFELGTGEKRQAPKDLAEATLVQLADSGLITGTFHDNGDNRHTMVFAITGRGIDTGEAYESRPEIIAKRNKKAKRGAA